MLRKIFSGEDPIFNIPDLFGYLIVVLIGWLCWTGYQRASTIAAKAHQEVSEVLVSNSALPSENDNVPGDGRSSIDSSVLPEGRAQLSNSDILPKLEEEGRGFLEVAKGVASDLSVESASQAIVGINETINKFLRNIIEQPSAKELRPAKSIREKTDKKAAFKDGLSTL